MGNPESFSKCPHIHTLRLACVAADTQQSQWVFWKVSRAGQMKRECTYCLTDDGVFDSIDATSKHSEGQRRVETEVEEHVPSLPTDADRAGRKTEK